MEWRLVLIDLWRPIANTGSAPQSVVVESTSEAFEIDTSGVPNPIPAGSSGLVSVVFHPAAAGAVSGEVRVLAQGEGTDALILPVEGMGEAVDVEGSGCAVGGAGGGFLLVLWALGVAGRRRGAARRS